MTVMFCERGLDSDVGRLDPEDMREIIAACRSAAGGTRRGFVDKFGDGDGIGFGYPQAHERR